MSKDGGNGKGRELTRVEIPSLYCLNVATTGAIVMYDRMVKGVGWVKK
ncbi:MAG: hypothetical protein NWE89_12295 [Candidatus Bathyarchaeota archaeon]|nr:hypothetical protein [Candidatus Bathyarchaeota archaeon]